jgi:hypothetical protein
MNNPFKRAQPGVDPRRWSLPAAKTPQHVPPATPGLSLGRRL